MDPITMMGIAQAASSAIGSIGSYFGGKEESKGQREANEMNMQIAREQMAFQERMANTSWQRGVADMRAAGINPMLAVSKGGASAPIGSTATMQNERAGIARGVSQAASTAAGAMNSYLTLKQMEAEARRLGAEATIAENKVPKSNVQALPWSALDKGIKKVTDYVGNIFSAKSGFAKVSSSKDKFSDPVTLAVNAGSTNAHDRRYTTSAKSVDTTASQRLMASIGRGLDNIRSSLHKRAYSKS